MLEEQTATTVTEPKPGPGLSTAREQIDRILASNTFRSSDVLRRFLKFLAEKTLSGEADELKEYSVGLDALGKPPTFDPRQDAAVRLQASRLRQKLEDYYRNEGVGDPLVIELPKGRFKIAWHTKAGDLPALSPLVLPPVTAQRPVEASPVVEPGNVRTWRRLALVFVALSTVLALIVAGTWFRASRPAALNPPVAGSTPELDSLWSPIVSSAHHLILAFSNPVFVNFQRDGGDITYRRRGTADWNDAITSPEFLFLRRSLGNPAINPDFNLVERSNLVSTFVLAQFLSRRRGDISLARTGDLSWQQFADNDVILFKPAANDPTHAAMPVQPAFVVDKAGVRDLHPLNGMSGLYADPPDHQERDGEGLELVSVMPGPMGRTTTVSFAGNHAWGVVGAVQALTDPAFARVAVEKLRGSSGKIPLYYQLLVKIRYRDGTPTNASYVTHRALTPTQNSAEAITMSGGGGKH